jgi:membrane protease YdiL (CAAX protease family)
MILFEIPAAMATPRHSVARCLASSAAQWIATGVVIRYAFRLSGLPVEDVLPLRRVPAAFVGAWVLLLLGALLLTLDLGVLLQKFLPKPASLRTVERGLMTGEGSPVSGFVVVVVAGPILEELLFRGVILHGLLQSYRRRRAIVASAVLFAVYHLNPWQLLPAFVLGLLFGYWRASTGSLLPGIAGHMLANGAVFAARLGEAPKPSEPLPVIPASAIAAMGVAALILLGTGALVLRKARRRPAA